MTGMRSGARLPGRAWAGAAAAVTTTLCALWPAAASATEGAASTVLIDTESVRQVERYLSDARAELGWPGLAAALVTGDEVLWSAGFGVADPDGREMTAQTPFLLASVSKSITAVALMRLVEAGMVGLDDPVTKYLPELAPTGDHLTVESLMVQRTGASTFAGHASFVGESASSLEANVSRLAPELQRGAGFEYSNANYDALALVVARASGKPFEDYLQHEVFGPLGMARASTEPTRAEQDGLATGYYHWLGAGYRPHTAPRPAGMVGSYGMFAGADDMAQIVKLHLNQGTVDGRRVLSPDSVAVLQSGQPLGAGARTTYAGGLFVDPPGMPWMQGDLANYLALRHDGSALNFRSYLWAMPGADVGLVVLVNANDWADESQLPRVAHNVQHLLFDVETGPMSGEPDLLKRWGKQLFALVAVAQITLAAASVRPLRRAWNGRRLGASGLGVLYASTAVDLIALAALVWLIPATTISPLLVVAQAPDARILLTVMSIGVVWGAIRTIMWTVAVRRRPVVHDATPAPT